MTPIEQIMQDTAFTDEEYHTYLKVKEHCFIEDLMSVCDDLEIDAKKLNREQIDRIQSKYTDLLCTEWCASLECAIDYVLEV